jgi:hypothetical protein
MKRLQMVLIIFFVVAITGIVCYATHIRYQEPEPTTPIYSDPYDSQPWPVLL